MMQDMVARVFAKKTIVSAAFTVLSLTGLAQAQTAGRPSVGPPSHTESAAGQQGSNYNFMAGGGG